MATKSISHKGHNIRAHNIKTEAGVWEARDMTNDTTIYSAYHNPFAGETYTIRKTTSGLWKIDNFADTRSHDSVTKAMQRIAEHLERTQAAEAVAHENEMQSAMAKAHARTGSVVLSEVTASTGAVVQSIPFTALVDADFLDDEDIVFN